MLPLNVGILLDMSILMANLIYAGLLNSNDLAAVGLAQTVAYLMMVSFVYGMSSSLDTLMSQEYGAGNYDNCAMYFNKTEFLTIIISVLFYPLFYFSAEILTLIGVDSQVAEVCQQYLVLYYGGSVMWIQCNNIKMQLRVQRIVWPSLVGSIVCLTFYFILIESMRALYGHSFQVIAITNTLAFTFQLVFLIILLICGVGEPRARRCIRKSDLQHWGEYCKIALPSLLLQMIQGWNFELVTLIVATFDPIQLAAQNIVGNLCGVYWIFSAFGIATSLSIIIGNAMGMKMVSLAKLIMRDMILISISLSCVLTLSYVFLRAQLLQIFTNDQRVIDAATPAYYAMSFAQLVDTTNWVAVGVLKGLGKIRWLPIFQIVGYYFFHQPLSILLIHFYQLGFETYWRILIIAITALATANYIYLATLNWDKVAEEIEERGTKEQLVLMRNDSHLSVHLL